MHTEMDSDEEYEAKAKIARREEARLKEEFQIEETDKQPEVPAPPDGGYGWVIVFASFICNMVVDGVAFSFGLLLPFLVEHFGESKGTTAWVGSLLTGFQLGAGPLVSVVANKFGCRIACLTGCLLASSALALSTICPSVTLMMLVYGVLGGIGYGFIYLPAVVMVGYYFESKRSLATGIAVCGTGVGAFAFAPLVTILLKNFGWKSTNLFLAGITLFCALFGALMKPLTYVEVKEEIVELKVPVRGTVRGRTSESNTSTPGAEYSSTLSITRRKGSVQLLVRKDILYTGSIQNLKEFQSRTSLAEYRHSVHSLNRSRSPKPSGNSFCNVSELLGDLLDLTLLKDAVFLVLAFATLFAIFAFYIPFVYLVELAKTKGIEETQGSILISIIGVTNIVGRIGVGFVADFPRVNNFLINNICLVLAAVAVVLMPLCSSFTTLAAVSVLFGFSVAGYISLTSIILVEFLGLDKLTNAFGLIILFRGAAATVGTPIAGTLYDYTGSYTIPFFVGGAAFAAAAAISISAPCFRKKTEIVDGEVAAPINVNEDKSDNVI